MPVYTTTREGVEKWRWRFAVGQLRTAYKAARSSIDDDLRRVAVEHQRFCDAPEPDPEDYSEEESHRAWEDHLIDRHWEAHNALAAIKQAFALILYHSWEQHSAKWAGWTGHYRYHQVRPRLVKAGYVVAEGVNKLNDVANCIKHDSDELWKRKDCRRMFEPIVAEMVAENIEPDYS
ncbi:MAG: hypothetical protein KJ631_13980, partial [Alphaproteobacteria bacterium]|nr:hypothetical protein [Alphaproteobacteria bacterium]